jgi:holo-[acyl-carrier protein] synthase
MGNNMMLRQIVADMLKMDAGEVGPDLPLNGRRLSGSIGRAALDAAIRRKLGVSCPKVYSAASFGELEAAVFGTPNAANGQSDSAARQPAAIDEKQPPKKDASGFNAAAARTRPAGAISCGVDIELADNLPPTADPWEHEFYRQTFTGAEIAYCLLQENPGPHFAARWCAKEALKKCDSIFLHEKNDSIELLSDGANPPILRHWVGPTAKVLPHAVSISHTESMAVAVVVKLHEPAAPSHLHAAMPAAIPAAREAREKNPLPRIPWVLAGLALAIALWALVRTFTQH